MGAVADLYARQQEEDSAQDRKTDVLVSATLLDAMATLRFYAEATPGELAEDVGSRARRTLAAAIKAIGQVA